MQTPGHGRRSTRRARQREARRHTYKQRGGADWAPNFTDPAYAARFPDWTTEINSDPELSALFPSLLMNNRNQSIITESTEEKQEQLKTYFASMAHQDKLFRAALNIIRKKVAAGLTPPISVDELSGGKIIAEAAVIDTMKPQMMEYFRDVERIIAFREDIDPPLPKLRAMYEDNTFCTLSTILLFPTRVENVFIMALSEIICNLIDDRSVLAQATNESLKTILASQYDSYAQALSHTLTAFPLRDGFFLNQGLNEVSRLSMREPRLLEAIERELSAAITDAQGRHDTLSASGSAATPDEVGTAKATLDKSKKEYDDFKRSETFWKEFITSAIRSIAVTVETDLFNNRSTSRKHPTCGYYIGDNTFADITADMLAYAILKGDVNNMNILELLGNACGPRLNILNFYSDTNLPEREYFDTPMLTVSAGLGGRTRNVTFKQILTVVDIATLEYLLHLEVAIKECWKRRHP